MIRRLLMVILKRVLLRVQSGRTRPIVVPMTTPLIFLFPGLTCRRGRWGRRRLTGWGGRLPLTFQALGQLMINRLTFMRFRRLVITLMKSRLLLMRLFPRVKILFSRFTPLAIQISRRLRLLTFLVVMGRLLVFMLLKSNVLNPLTVPVLILGVIPFSLFPVRCVRLFLLMVVPRVATRTRGFTPLTGKTLMRTLVVLFVRCQSGASRRLIFFRVVVVKTFGRQSCLSSSVRFKFRSS